MHCSLCMFPITSLHEVFSGCFKQVFFHLGDKIVIAGRLRQVEVLYSNNGMGICLGGLSTGHLRRVVVL